MSCFSFCSLSEFFFSFTVNIIEYQFFSFKGLRDGNFDSKTWNEIRKKWLSDWKPCEINTCEHIKKRMHIFLVITMLIFLYLNFSHDICMIISFKHNCNIFSLSSSHSFYYGMISYFFLPCLFFFYFLICSDLIIYVIERRCKFLRDL